MDQAKLLQYAETIYQRFPAPGAFLVAGTGDSANPMTIGWGYVGICWRKPVMVVAVRDSRHTQPLMDKHHEFTVSMPLSGMEAELGKAGSTSGRDGDKWAGCGLEKAVAHTVSVPAVRMENGITLECKTVMVSDMRDGFVDPDILSTFYKDDDTHKLYFGVIQDIY